MLYYCYDTVIFDHPFPIAPVPVYTYRFRFVPELPDSIILPVAVVACVGVVVLGVSINISLIVVDPDIESEPVIVLFPTRVVESLTVRDPVIAVVISALAGPAVRALDKSDNAYGIGANDK